MVSIRQQIQHNSGIPLGGIGTGSVEIRADGLFHQWHMFNVGQWNPNAPCGGKDPAMRPEDLVFMVRTSTPDGTVIARYLALREKLHDLYSLAWLRSVEAIEFEGTFPVARLSYEDSELPVRVQAEVFSPFVPLDSRTSGTPGFYVYFTMKNLTDAPVEVSILGVMKNAAGYDQGTRRARNRLVEGGAGPSDPASAAPLRSADRSNWTGIVLGADGLEKGECSTGDMAFAAVGGEISHVTGAYIRDRAVDWSWGSKFGVKTYTFLHQFHDSGSLPNLNAETKPEFREDFDASKLTEAERAQMLEELLQHPRFYDKYHQLALADPEMVNSPAFLDDAMREMPRLEKIEWGWAALCSKQTLEPEAEGEALFTVGWYFPNHISPTGENIGHQYEHWFSGSEDVIRFLMEHFGVYRSKTLALAEAIHGSSMPEEAADAVTGQLSTLTKCTWWTRAGHFGVWEGYGCCGFHTTDITYQGSFPIVSLFPDLQKMQMEHGAGFQREDGRVHHFFIPDFSAVDDGFDRVDMNQQFVMLAARDYLWSGDKAYLERLWPHIIRAMDNTALLDNDGDGLPDTDTRRNTYDAWDFQGCPSYIASLWLGALKAGTRLAGEMGDEQRRAKWQSEYDMGLASYESKLWNGEYYVLWRDGDQVDECCMSDQMSGDWFAAACGWGPILDPERIRLALSAIVRFNFREGEGLLNASYPPYKQRRPAASGNVQADSPWTGIEYTLAALLIENGMVVDGLAIVRDIHDRYLRAGRFWNHVECGGHYYRAMSSWTVMLALSGFAWDQPTGVLTFAPAIEETACEYPFFTPMAWGRYYQESGVAGRAVVLELEEGEMALSKLCLPKISGFGNADVTVGDEDVPTDASRSGEGICLVFETPVVLTPERSLVVRP